MDSFFVNGYLWRIKRVPYASPMLIEKTGTRTVATTDPITRTVLGEEAWSFIPYELERLVV